jgi:hypothetical protein
VGEAQAVHGPRVGGDIGGGEAGLVAGGGEQRGDVGDGGIVAADKVLRRVGDRRRDSVRMSWW